jgi:perosamine synthetase
MNCRIPVAQPEIGEEEIENVTSAVKSGWVSSKGPFIDEFEKSFSQYVGTKHAISVSNGTVALHLALIALGIKPGDKVIVPSLDFISVANAVTYVGATPIFVDSDPQYWCLDPSVLRADKHTKAIIAVHLYGHPCDMDRIMEFAEENKIVVIEDCAEAHGAKYKGKMVGTFGAISCFSFYGNKIITTGEGGMCLTDDEALARQIRILRDHGMNPQRRYWHDVVGFNYRLTNLQAALGVAQVKKIDVQIEKKRRIAKAYNIMLKDVSGITLPPEMPWAKSVFWLYSILIERSNRDLLIDRLDKVGIESRPFFYPSHLMPPHKIDISLPVAEKLSSIGINLPSGPNISEDQIKEISEYIQKFVE